MIIEFQNEDCDRLEIDPSFTKGLPPGVVKAYRMRIQAIRAAIDERTFYAMKSWHYKSLQGKRNHQKSIRLNDQYRLIVELEDRNNGKCVVVIGVEDYH